MPKDQYGYEGDAEAYRRSLENPEEFWADWEKHKLEAISLPKKPKVRRRLRQSQQVGYKRPPIATQFKPGQSGNPKGRPRGKNFGTLIEEILTDKITLREGGKTRRITRLEAVLLKQMSLALNGNLRAIQTICATANELGLLKPRPLKLVPGNDLSHFSMEELQEFERLLYKASARVVEAE